ncbi:MAG TPA: ABC transporter substrate-binding protein [Stellaceae bacterium]|nr:ABC transporter substrate-binding protein [Stellaceae bacterium]
MRWSSCAVMLAALGVGGLPVAATAATTLTVGKAAATASVMLPVNLGVDFGIFTKHGLDVKVADFSGGSKLFQAMTAGSVDIGIATGTGMAFTVKGAPILAVCEHEAQMTPSGIGVPWNSPVHSVDDLKGKRVGISSPGSFTDWLASEVARQRGWGPEGLTKISIGNGMASGVAAFRTDTVDAAIIPTAELLEMEEKHEGRLLASVAPFAGNMAAGTIFATKQVMADHPDAVRAFLAGWLETIDYMRKHKDETVKAMSALTGFSPKVMAKEYDINMPSFVRDCKFDAESLANLKRSFVELKLLDTAPDMSTLYTDAFMPK